MKNKGSGWRNESRRHSLARKGIKTVIDDNRRFDVSKFVARGENQKSNYYLDGYDAGVYSAETNLAEDFDGLVEAYKNDELGDVVGELREHQTQFAGDISYDVMYDEEDTPTPTKWIKPSEYDEWEDGFYSGFYDAVRMAYINDNLLAIYDNGGRTADRYSVIFNDGDLIGMNNIPFNPSMGFNQYAGNIHDWGLKSFSHLGAEISLEDLNDDVIKAIENRIA